MWFRVLAFFLAFSCMAQFAIAQDARGSITGRVTDPQGGVIAGAKVIINNTETNTATTLTTGDSGNFEANLLNAGLYSVTVEHSGFKKSIRNGLTLNVAGRLEMDFQLQIGAAVEVISVTAEAPLIDTTSASGGRVIDNKQIMQLPFSDMNPFALATLAPGMQWTGQPEYRRPFDNGGTSSFNTAGGVGSNEYTIDGAPATGTGRRVGFVPPSDAVEEFKLETSPFDASYGHTSGATVNVMTKAGTNTWHGSLYDQHWQQRWNATQHFDRLAFEDAVRQGKAKADDQRQATGRSNNFGATIGGPVRIPKLYDGRNKTFFFFSYNGIYQSKTETTDSKNITVPKLAWRTGDFSDLLAIDATKYTVYDPRSATQQGNRVVRTPFPGNKGVPILNPTYKFYTDLYPSPNDVPGLVSNDGINNFLAVGMPKNEKFNSMVNRIDQNLGQKQRLFGRWFWNHRLADEYDWTYPTKRGLHSNGLTRINHGVGMTYNYTLSSTQLLDVGISWSRFQEGSQNDIQTSYKPSDVGLPAYLDTKADQYKLLPSIRFSNITGVSGGYPGITAKGATGEARVTMNSVFGNHSIKYGYTERRYQFTASGAGNSAGTFNFGNSYTRAANDTNTASGHGLDWASFMMGLPNSISVDTNDTAFWTTPWRALFVQDDFRITSKLRLSMGLRYEREGGTYERYDRGVSGGIIGDLKYTWSDAVVAAYAKNPLAELPAAQFKVIGGGEYLGARTKSYSDGTHTFQPRIGAVYSINSKTVIRTGYGMYYDTLNVANDRPSQAGFSQATGTTLTNDNGLTFCCGTNSISGLTASNNPMTNPFPVRADGTRFDVPLRNSLGANRLVGTGFTLLPRDFTPARQSRWRVGVQRELRKDLMIDVSYNGAYSSVPLVQRIDYLPGQYWATGNTRNQAVDDFLNGTVPNPFNISNLTGLKTSDPAVYRYFSTQGFFTGTTTSRNRLLRQYPQLNGWNGARPGGDIVRGGNKYNDLQLLLERRFAKGFMSSLIYTYSRSTEADFFANEFDTTPTSRIQDANRPHRFVWTGIYELPFGKGRQYLKSGPLQHIAGGWQMSWVYQRQSGPVTSWGNRFFYGDINGIGDLFKHESVNSSDIHQWFDPSIAYRGTGAIPQGFVGFEGRTANQPGSYQVRVFPTRLEDLREDGIRNWDVKLLRKFKLHERLNTTFAVDLLNATNHTNFSGPNTDPTNMSTFGRVTSQRGLSRLIQFNLRFDF